MTDTELEEAIDSLILESGLSMDDVVGVLEIMADRYAEQVRNEKD
jgi:hypothetical protein